MHIYVLSIIKVAFYLIISIIDKKIKRMARITDESYVTLATNENYALGALNLGRSLRQVNTNRKLTVMITADLPDALK